MSIRGQISLSRNRSSQSARAIVWRAISQVMARSFSESPLLFQPITEHVIAGFKVSAGEDMVQELGKALAARHALARIKVTRGRASEDKCLSLSITRHNKNDSQRTSG